MQPSSPCAVALLQGEKKAACERRKVLGGGGSLTGSTFRIPQAPKPAAPTAIGEECERQPTRPSPSADSLPPSPPWAPLPQQQRTPRTRRCSRTRSSCA